MRATVGRCSSPVVEARRRQSSIRRAAAGSWLFCHGDAKRTTSTALGDVYICEVDKTRTLPCTSHLTQCIREDPKKGISAGQHITLAKASAVALESCN